MPSSPSPTYKNYKKGIPSRESSKSPPKRQRSGFSDTSSDTCGALSPATEYRLTQERLREYNKRQAGLAEKNRRRVADAIALATKYLRKPLNVPRVTVKEFLRACENEANMRRRKTCQRASYFMKSPDYCEDTCAQCEANQIQDGLRPVAPPGSYRCQKHCCMCSPVTDIGMKSRSPTPVSFCRKVELQNRMSPTGNVPCSQLSGPPPASPHAARTVTSEGRGSTAIGTTPDSEYDTGKRNELINKFLPKPKTMHFQCRPRTRMFLYTDKAMSCNIQHHPYAVYRGKKIITASGKRRDGVLQKSNFKVPQLGVSYIIPDINPNIGQRRAPPPHPRARPQWTKTSVLPPIKTKVLARQEEE